MFSRHLAHSRWQPQLPFSLQFRSHFPSVCLPLLSTFVSAFGDGEAAGKPPEATCGWRNSVLRLWAVCKGEETWIPTCLVREAQARPVPTGV